MPKKTYAYAILEGLAQEMRKDPNLCHCYEYAMPVATLATGELLDLRQEFPYPRTSGRWGWPIDEDWYAGWATGMGASGMPVVAKFPYQAELFFVEYMYNQIGKIRSMTGGQASMPVVIWISGASRGRGLAGQHTDVGCEVVYAYMAGIKVVVPSNAYDAKGLMVAAIRSGDPVVFRDYSEVASGDQPDVPDDAYEVPIGKAVVRQEGKDLTIVAWAPATVEVVKALPGIASAGISVEYIDPRTLKPLDVDTLVTSVKKTGRMLVVDHANYTAGFSSHVISEVVQKVPGAKCAKIAFPDAPGPGNAGMMAWMRPDAPKIVDAAQKLMKL